MQGWMTRPGRRRMCSRRRPHRERPRPQRSPPAFAPCCPCRLPTASACVAPWRQHSKMGGGGGGWEQEGGRGRRGAKLCGLEAWSVSAAVVGGVEECRPRRSSSGDPLKYQKTSPKAIPGPRGGTEAEQGMEPSIATRQSQSTKLPRARTGERRWGSGLGDAAPLCHPANPATPSRAPPHAPEYRLAYYAPHTHTVKANAVCRPIRSPGGIPPPQRKDRRAIRRSFESLTESMEAPGERLTWPAWRTACRWVSSGAVPHRAVSSRRQTGGTSRRRTQSGRRGGGTTLGPIGTQTMPSAGVALAAAARDKTGKRRGDRTGEALSRSWSLCRRLSFSRGVLIGDGAAWCRSSFGGSLGQTLVKQRGGPLYIDNRIDRGSKLT